MQIAQHFLYDVAATPVTIPQRPDIPGKAFARLYNAWHIAISFRNVSFSVGRNWGGRITHYDLVVGDIVRMSVVGVMFRIGLC